MPVKLGSRTGQETEARIEIIPLIDIMFFLLAAFMLVSLSMVSLKSVKVNLPSATSADADADTRKDLLSISVDRSGTLFLDRQPVGINELAMALAAARRTNDTLRVFISGDQDSRHGDVIKALDVVRSAGIEQVGFEIRPTPSATQP